jgi:UDP-N-acetylmuramoyl-L-alanyl-D-glutamate--2,6-diaminopimelate ligase
MPAVLRPDARPVRLIDVARLIGVADPGSDPAAEVAGVTLDSRSVLPGDLYAALPGHVTHGAHFAAVAVSAGAAAILTDPIGAAECRATGVPVLVADTPRSRLGSIASFVYGNPSASLHMLGITGTNGKTTVSAMVESGLRAAGRATGMIGTVGIQINGAVHTGARTTPEATDLHAILAVMRDAGVDSVVMEVSSIALEESRVDGVVYDVAAFTNLSQDHLDYHGSMEAYFDAKAALFTRERARRAIIGVDDRWGRELAARTTIDAETWSLVDPRAAWHAQRANAGLHVAGPGGEIQRLTVPMPGSFNVANAICAYAVLRRAGVSPDDAVQGISTVQVPGRMQVVEGGGISGIVDYAHSPDAIERVLRAARDEHDGRLIAVVGAGGDRDRGKRPLMGSTAARLADVLVITDDNPRSEPPGEIRAALREGALLVAPGERAEVHEHADRRTAITVAVAMAEAGDVVLVLGKGHEQGQDVAGVVTPFDDATVLGEALRDGASA